MSLLFLDSFDHYATIDLGLKWSATSGSATIAATSGRRGGGAMQIPDNTTMRKDIGGARTLITGFAMKITGFTTSSDPSSSSSSIHWMTLGNADGTHLYCSVFSDGSIGVYRRITTSASSAGYGLLGRTTGGVLQPNVYAYVEVKATISASATGQVKVLVNGVAVLNLVNIITISAFSTIETISRVLLIGVSGPGSPNNTFFDDLYICDSAGTVNNDFFGDVRIDVVKPNADGTYRDFVPDTGTAHFSRVNEAVADQTSYVASSTIGAKESYQFEDLASIVGVVRGVQIVDVSIKDDAGARSISHLVRSGISEEFSSAIPLSTDRKFYTSVHERDPATGGNWTQTSINAAEFGIVVAA